MCHLRFKQFFLLLAVIFISGCAAVVPVHEAETPEVLDSGKFRISQFSANAPMLASKQSDLITTSDGLTSEIGGYRLGFGLSEKLQLNLDIFASFLGGGGSFAGRYQWKGDNYFKAKDDNKSQTTVVRSFSTVAADFDLDEGNNAYAYADLDASGIDVSHLFGVRTANWFGLYAGPKIITGRVKTDYKQTEGGPIVKSDRRNFNGYGGVAGLFFAWTGQHIGFDIAIEYTGFSLPATYKDESAWYNGVAVLMGVPFGW